MSAIDQMLYKAPLPVDRGRPRMWVDRVFSIPGAGTVATGTLTGGPVGTGEKLQALPLDREIRVRGIQSHNASVERLEPGNRAALNLVGVSHKQLARGDALARSEQWHCTRTVDASLTTLVSLGHPVSKRGSFLAYLGSGEHATRLRVLGEGRLQPGETGAVRLHLPCELPLLPGDRYILRETGRAETVGGGEILDIDPVTSAARARPDRSIDRVIAERGWIERDHLRRLTGEDRPPTLGRWIVDRHRLDEDRARLSERIAKAGYLGLDTASLDEQQVELIETLDDVTVHSGRVRASDSVDRIEDHPWLAALYDDLFAPPEPPDDLDAAEIRALIHRGEAVDLDGIKFATTAPDAAADIVSHLLDQQPEGVAVSEVKEALGTSRKYALPLLRHLDATGRTRRRGDVRIAGPRL
ncbi:MAG: SelB C-terminal domain-containing protein [Acidimicrobiales bacterium]|nr:SelB C-terminal domain-containing protein [Acidimicrobiales bacterium]